MLESSEDGINWGGFFWIGLIGIIATGLIVGMGGDNFWALSKVGGIAGTQSLSHRGQILFFLGAILVGLADICAGGVIFAGGVLIVQRLRGRI
jgi:hypothetical protein